MIATGGRLLRQRDGRWHATGGLPDVLSIVGDGGDGLWLLGSALWHWRDGALREVPLPPLASSTVTSYDVQALAVAPDGALWMSLLGGGLYRHDAAGWQLRVPAQVTLPRVMAFDAAGRLWTADTDGRVFWHAGGRHGQLPATGLDVGAVTALLPGRGHFPVAGERGLIASTEAASIRLERADAAGLVAVTGMAEAADGSLWFNGGRGVVVMEAAQAAAFAHGERPRYRLFDERDGLLGVAVQSNATPTPSHREDGRLWFSTNQGVALIEPARVGYNPRPPQVLLRSVSAGGREYTPDPGLELPALTRSLVISYTSTSLGAPERVAFRYRLDGVDEAWQDAGPRRQAFYTNLAPGEYRFEVIAANEDGVWSREPAVQSLRIRPAFYQTWWFLLLCVLTAVGGLWLAYLMRLKQLGRHIRGRLQERHAERERIARELHDTLLQSIHGLILRFQAVSETLPPLDPARSAMEQALQRADDVLVEGRDRVLDLRATAPDAGDLEELLEAVGEELAPLCEACFEVTATGSAEMLDPIVRDELYRIGREAMLNACRHARPAASAWRSPMARARCGCACSMMAGASIRRRSSAAVAPATGACTACVSVPSGSVRSCGYGHGQTPGPRSNCGSPRAAPTARA
ncbi:hypothetical protein H1235_15290 [Pseudoxanthomonas sp. NC8]|nr:hypothetical protein H1235_15290 [Pseudoxanthomonas sp. NC8]